MKRNSKKALWITLAALLVVAALISIFWKQLWLIRYNAFPTVFNLPETDEWSGGRTLDVVYSDISDNTYLTLYLPDDPGEDTPPLMILLYGGGAVMNDNHSRQMRLLYDYFRDHGYACASVNYRLAREAIAPAAIEDAKAAIRFLRLHAEEYGYDPERFVIAGESTGVYLGFLAAITDEQTFSSVPVRGQTDSAPISSEVSAIVDFYAFMDPFAEDDAPIELPEWVTAPANAWVEVYLTEGLPSWLESWVGKRNAEMTDADKAMLTPYTYFAANRERINRLAVWIAHGDAEITVPITQSKHFYERLCSLRGLTPNWDAATRSGTTDRLHLEIEHSFKHADDRFYTDEMLQRVDAFLRDTWK